MLLVICVIGRYFAARLLRVEFTTRTSGSRSSFSQGIIHVCVCACARAYLHVCMYKYVYVYINIESLAEFGSASVESTLE